jgi:amino acid transporter
VSATAATGQHPGTPGISDDDKRLHELGYPRTLLPKMSFFESFAIPFSTISILTGPVTLFTFAMNTGGPAALMWTWILGGPLVLCVAAAMGRIGSAYPVAGAVYFWTAKLAKRHPVFASWAAAWLNGLGKLAGTAAAAYSTAFFIGALASIQWGVAITPLRTLGIFAAILVGCGLLNALAVRLVGLFNAASVVVHVGGVIVIVFALTVLPTHHQAVGYVFGHFANNTGWRHSWYVWMLAPLTLMYTMTGIDSAGDMSEETRQAAKNPPRAMLQSVLWSWILGGLLCFAFLYAIQNYDGEAASAYGVAPAQILKDALPGSLATVLIVWIIIAQLLCVMSCFTASPRMGYAIGRDRAVPFSRWLYSVNRNRVPVRALALAVIGSFAIGLPAYWSLTLFFAVTSVSAAALFVSYAIPIYLSLRRGDEFEPGPWNLKRPRLIGGIAIGYIAVASVLICLPTNRDFLHPAAFNWTPVALVAALAGVTAWYWLGGRKTYTGPVSYGTPDELAAMEADLA